MKNRCLKIYFSDIKETFIVNIVMMFIITFILFIFSFPFYFYFINLIIASFFLIYYKSEIKMYFLIYNDLKKCNINKKIVIFNKIETDYKYGKPKRRELFKKYFTPRYSFYFEKELFRIGFKIDSVFYNDIRGKEFEIEYLTNTKVIIGIKPLFHVKEYDKQKYLTCFGNCSFKEEE